MQHKDMCLCACGFDPVDQLLWCVDVLAFFHCEKAHSAVLTHQVFPVFQSSPVTPADESGGHSQMQSVSVFTVVSTKIWAGPVLHTAVQFFLNLIFSLHDCHHNIFFPWNNLVRRTFYLLLGLSPGKQTGIRQWLGEHTLVPLIETSWHIKKEGKEGLKLGDMGPVMRHGVGSGRGLSSNDVFTVPPRGKCCPLNC